MSTRPFNSTPLSGPARRILDCFTTEVRYKDAGVEILKAKVPRHKKERRDEARAILRDEDDVRFAGRVLVDPISKLPVIYTENFFIQFRIDISETDCRRCIEEYGLHVKRMLEYLDNAYFVAAPESTGRQVFSLANKLLNDPKVTLCHPEMVRQARSRSAYPPQWHLMQTTINGKLISESANVEDAWELSDGTGATIAIIDDGIEIDHEEFQTNGKVVAPRNVSARTSDPRPGDNDNHGTACAGVACADGLHGAAGVAPGARLLPIRMASALGSMAEADAFIWAARHGADVISCSWGPRDGRWYDPHDPVHDQIVPIPDSTRLAIDYAVNRGRRGKGCVVCFAAGNGNESIMNDGYSSYEKVIAVAACNDLGRKSVYSDHGEAVWCCFPSNDGIPSETPGIWTTDRTGPVGFNPGNTNQGDALGNYTNSFGGTSSSCPGAAGVATLILARNPRLRSEQVREIMRNSCEVIDPAGGQYDTNGHSPYYGYGRLNARKAVELASAYNQSPNPTITASSQLSESSKAIG